MERLSGKRMWSLPEIPARVVPGFSQQGGMKMTTVAHSKTRASPDYFTCADVITRSRRLQQILKLVPVIAKSDCSVLICGETGTGKDLLAKVIHNEGRREGPFIKVNCVALPESLLESELFGYVRGAFTGADTDKPGRFQLADGGTIFLDEIGDMPLSLQAKLLMVLDEKEFYPLGGRRLLKVDARVVAATNRDLREQVRTNRFREDLFHRLNVMSIELPPLRERREDIPLLIRHFIDRLNRQEGRCLEGVSEEALAMLLHHDYPGNVRELYNWLNHASILCQDEHLIRPEHLASYLGLLQLGRSPAARSAANGSEAERIRAVLEEVHWNRREAARRLGMDRTTLWRKIKKYGIS
jgi:transcriptional regulator with PAS, ATPase and Fis domain